MKPEGGGYIAEFMGPDKRNKDANWFKGTHFVLGDDKNRVMKSQAHRQFQHPTKAETAPNTYDSNAMTRTHFLLGKEKDLGTTTAHASYQPPSSGFVPSALDEKTKADLRKSHFDLAGDAGRYTTTNKRDYIPKQATGSARNDQEERKAKMRKHNFNFGKEENQMITTNKSSFQNYSGTGAANLTSNTSNDIRKTHFQLGGESAPMRTVHQIEFREKSGITAGKTKDSIAFQCTNFVLGDDKANKISSSHMHYKYYPQGQSGKLNRDQLNQLRKEHFILGKHPHQFKSVNQLTYGDKGMAAVDPVSNRHWTQSSSVRIGNPNLAKNFFQTSYEVANQSRPLGNNIYQTDSIAKEGSHFDIGDASRPIGKSQNQITYRPLDHSAAQPDMDFEKRIRSNHFDLGMGNSIPGQYTSVAHSAHDHKGNAADIRSKLDIQRKNDLTASHFRVGGDNLRMRTTMQASYMNMGPSSAAFNNDKKSDLRNSHFVLGDPANADFKTNHEINFRPFKIDNSSKH